MGYFSQLLLIAVSTAIVNNVVLSQFLGLCPFLGVSKKINTAAGMGGAVIGVITISSAVCSLIYDCILTPLKLTYLNTIVFILVIAALVQFVEMFLKKTSPSLYEALGMERAVLEQGQQPPEQFVMLLKRHQRITSLFDEAFWVTR